MCHALFQGLYRVSLHFTPTRWEGEGGYPHPHFADEGEEALRGVSNCPDVEFRIYIQSFHSQIGFI